MFTVEVSSGEVYVRTAWDATYDAVQKVLISTTRTAQANNPVEFGGARKIPVATAASATASTWAGSGASNPLANQLDDAPPLHINSSYIGGNHGAAIGKQCTCTAHGKTEADIGSLWDGPYTKNYTIARIVDANTLLLFSEKGAASNNYDTYWGQEVTTLSSVTMAHLAGATNTASLSISSSSTTSVGPVLNNRSVTVKIDGTAINTATNAVYTCAKIEIDEVYGIANPPKLWDWLRSAVGTLTNNWTVPNSVETDVTVTNRYRCAANGAWSNKVSYQFNKSVTLGYLGGVQALAPYYSGTTLSGYAHGVSAVTVGANTYDFQALAPLATIPADVDIPAANWTATKRPPGMLAEVVLNAGTPEFGVALGFSPVRGDTAMAFAAANKNTAGMISSSRKMYPKAVVGAALASAIIAAGKQYSINAFRHVYPLSRSPDASVCTWFWDDDEITVHVAFHKLSALTTIPLCADVNGWTVSVVTATSVSLLSPVVVGAVVPVECTATYGYAVLRVSKPAVANA